MFMSNVVTSFVALLCANFCLVNALAIAQRDVFDPPITYPTAGTVWHVGESHNVTWNTSILPSGFNGTGMIVLGFLDNSGDGNEHLDLANPLAKGFELIAGQADITVPSVTTRDTYILVLFGDSGNASPTFTISNLTIGTPPSSPSTSGGSAGTTSTTTTSLVVTDTSAVPSGASSAPDPTTTSIPSGSVPTISAPPVVSASTLPVISGSANSTATSVSGLSSSSATATSLALATASTGTTHNAGSRATSLGGAAIWLPIAVFLVSYL